MKKTVLVLLGLTFAFLSFPHKALAAGGIINNATTITASPTSLPADGSSATTISIHIYELDVVQCTNGQLSYTEGEQQWITSAEQDCINSGNTYVLTPDYPIPGCQVALSVSGSGNTMSASSVTTDSSGNASFTLKSSVAETKTVTMSDSTGLACESTYNGSFFPNSTTVTFTILPAASASSLTGTPKTTTKASSSPASIPTATSTPPTTPTLSTATANNAALSTANPQIETGQPLVLSGKTVPNGVVTLTIHSTPRTVIATADKNGNWSYTVTGLEAGNHTVQASVKDPTTGLSSPTTQILAFSIKARPVAAINSSKTATKKASKAPLLITLLFVIVLVLAGGGWYAWAKLKKSPPTATN